jgi:hypothetical protein
MKPLLLSAILLTTLTTYATPQSKPQDKKILKLPQIEQPRIQTPMVFVPNSTCKIEAVPLEDLTINDKVKTCAKDHSWLKI